MNNYPFSYRITFFIKGNNFNIEKRYDKYATMFAEKYHCEGKRDYFPLILPNAILRQMVATFFNRSTGIVVKIQEGRVDIMAQKTEDQSLVILKDRIKELLEIYALLFDTRNDLVINRIACCSAYVFDGDEGELSKCYNNIVNDFGEDTPVEWNIQRISRLSDYKDIFPAPITNNISIRRSTIKGLFEKKGQSRVLVEIDLNSFPMDISFDADTIARFFLEMPNNEERVYKAIHDKLLQ